MDHSSGKVSPMSQQIKNPCTLLNNIISVIEARSDEIIDKWKQFFGETDYYC